MTVIRVCLCEVKADTARARACACVRAASCEPTLLCSVRSSFAPQSPHTGSLEGGFYSKVHPLPPPCSDTRSERSVDVMFTLRSYLSYTVSKSKTLNKLNYFKKLFYEMLSTCLVNSNGFGYRSCGSNRSPEILNTTIISHYSEIIFL